MEIRLFIIACVMYIFAFVSRKLDKQGALKDGSSFALWHTLYLIFILNAVWFLFLFVSVGGTGEIFPMGKMLVGSAGVLAYSIYRYFSVKKADEKRREALKKSAFDWCNTVYFAGFVASVVMFFFLQAFKIPSASMRDTLIEGDHLFVNKVAYGLRNPFSKSYLIDFRPIQRGDIIIFRFPAKDRTQENCGGSQYGRDFVKRVIGLPGEQVEVKDQQIFINGQPLPAQPYEKYDDIPRVHYTDDMPAQTYQKLWEDHQLDSYYGMYVRDQFGPVTVPQDGYFVMGDNRDNSCDGRFWGPVPAENIKGKAWFVHWPLKRMKWIK